MYRCRRAKCVISALPIGQALLPGWGSGLSREPSEVVRWTCMQPAESREKGIRSERCPQSTLILILILRGIIIQKHLGARHLDSLSDLQQIQDSPTGITLSSSVFGVKPRFFKSIY